MSDAPEGGNNSGETPAADEFTPITSQEDFDKALSKRLERERAKFSDYDDLRAKAGKFDEIDAANKTEIEKSEDRANKAEAEVAKVPALVAEQLRKHLTDLHKISNDRADLYLTATDPELLLKQVAGLVDLEADRKKNGNHAPREGDNHASKGEGIDREFVRQLFSPTE